LIHYSSPSAPLRDIHIDIDIDIDINFDVDVDIAFSFPPSLYPSLVRILIDIVALAVLVRRICHSASPRLIPMLQCRTIVNAV
jgi:hypothetical protein